MIREKEHYFRKKMEVLFGVLCCCLLLTGCKTDSTDVSWNLETTTQCNSEMLHDSEESSNQSGELMESRKIVVHVCGEVVNPGVYELEENSRLHEAIELAGGMTPQADKDFLNLARQVVDGEQVCVPDRKQAEISRNQSAELKNSLVNINTASQKELTSISGIGDSRAQAIISYREANGRFNKIEDIKKVQGIKDSLFEKIKDKITV